MSEHGEAPECRPPSPFRLDPDSSPEVYEGLLDDAELEALLSDIETLSEAIDVRVRSSDRPVNVATVDISDVAARMRGATPLAVQIRYRFGGRHWCDSLQRVPNGIRIVRIAHRDESGCP